MRTWSYDTCGSDLTWRPKTTFWEVGPIFPSESALVFRTFPARNLKRRLPLVPKSALFFRTFPSRILTGRLVPSFLLSQLFFFRTFLSLILTGSLVPSFASESALFSRTCLPWIFTGRLAPSFLLSQLSSSELFHLGLWQGGCWRVSF